jgi:hypothetical protein
MPIIFNNPILSRREEAKIILGVQAVQRDPSMSGDRQIMDAFQSATTEYVKSATQVWMQTKTKAISGWQRLLALISGIRPFPEVRYWALRPLLWSVLLILLALFGLQTLYVNARTTFGAAGVYDYLGLFLWG